MEQAKDASNDIQLSCEQARAALDAEDLTAFDAKIDLSLERAKFQMD